MDEEEIIEIAPDSLGRRHACKNIEVRSVGKGRKIIGQLIFLYRAGQRQFRVDPLFLRCRCCQILYIIIHVRFHLIDRQRQIR